MKVYHMGEKVICEKCGREISKSNYSKHLQGHENHPERYIVSKYRVQKHDGLVCQFCGKECKNKNSLTQHEIRCKENPNRLVSTGQALMNYTALNGSWNKGLTKEIDSRVEKFSETLKQGYMSGRLIPSWQGKKHTEEQKNKISNSRKKFLSENPDKVPYLLNHSSKMSYPEEYFIDVFNQECIDLEYHKQISKYQLDFCNYEKKVDIEIDGEQHYLDKNIFKSDREHDNYFSALGWKIYRIRWSNYQKLDFEQKKVILQEIKDLLI